MTAVAGARVLRALPSARPHCARSAPRSGKGSKLCVVWLEDAAAAAAAAALTLALV